jgi:hypothetical protein
MSIEERTKQSRARSEMQGQRRSRWVRHALRRLILLTLLFALMPELPGPKIAANPLPDDPPPGITQACAESKAPDCDRSESDKDSAGSNPQTAKDSSSDPPFERGTELTFHKIWYEVDADGTLTLVDPHPSLVASFRVYAGDRPAHEFTCSGEDENPDWWCSSFVVLSREFSGGIPIVIEEVHLDDEWVLYAVDGPACTGDVCTFFLSNVRRDGLERITRHPRSYTVRLNKRWLEPDGSPANSHPATELLLIVNDWTRLRVTCPAGSGADQVCGTVVLLRRPTSLRVVEPIVPEGWAVITQGEFTCPEEPGLCEGTVVNQRSTQRPVGGCPSCGDDASGSGTSGGDTIDPPGTSTDTARPSAQIPGPGEPMLPAREDAPIDTEYSGGVLGTSHSHQLETVEQAALPQVLPRTGDPVRQPEKWSIISLAFALIVITTGLLMRAGVTRKRRRAS